MLNLGTQDSLTRLLVFHDCTLLAESPERLAEWRERIRVFLREQLALELNDSRSRPLPPTRRGARHGFPKDQLPRRLEGLLAADQ